MTYQFKKVTPFKIDIIRASYQSTNQIALSGSLPNTSASISSNRLTIPSGSDWYICCSAGQKYGTGNGAATTMQIWDYTNSQYIGIKANCTGWESLVRGRSAACALILDSEISTSLELGFWYQTASSGTWYSNDADMYQFITLQIMELPA